MSQLTINNGESGSTVRSKLNTNFAELYNGQTPVTVTQFVANTNNLSLTTGNTFLLSGDAARDLTGIVAVTDKSLLLVNKGSFTITLRHQSTSSTAANRFLCSTGSDVPIGPDEGIYLFYNSVVSRWHVFGPATPQLDAYSTTQGTILYRGASVWSVLAPGTAGQLLQTGGAAANPSYTSTVSALTITALTTTTLTLPTNGQVLLTVPTTDGHATGPTTSSFNCGYTSSAVGDLVYLDSSATWQKCDANTLALYNGMLGIALAIAASGASLLVALPGSFVYATAFPTFTIGSPVYMSETAGAVTQTAPTTTDSATRIIGWGVHADKMWFQPSPNYITHT